MPPNPFAGRDRGFADLPTPRLLTLQSRYLAWRAAIEAERRSWLQPETAHLYTTAVLDELDALLVERAVAAA